MEAVNILPRARSLKLRIFYGIVAIFLSAYAGLVLIHQFRAGFDPLGTIFGLAAGISGLCCWRFALSSGIASTRTRTPTKIALWFGCILGLIGFLGGFLGPIIFTPHANQGPLLGVFITGPLGFIVGVVLGLLYGLVSQRQARTGQKTSNS